MSDRIKIIAAVLLVGLVLVGIFAAISASKVVAWIVCGLVVCWVAFGIGISIASECGWKWRKAKHKITRLETWPSDTGIRAKAHCNCGKSFYSPDGSKTVTWMKEHPYA